MTEEQKCRLEELRERRFRNLQKESLTQKLVDRLRPDLYQILEPETKEFIQNGSDEWPGDKWERNLCIQTETSNTVLITTILSRFNMINPFNYSYVFLSRYDSFILQVTNQTLSEEWTKLIAADGDDIICYIPGRKDYVGIELIKEKMVGKEDRAPCWLYELTFSNEKLKSELFYNCA
jgi:hypothetical protein